MVLEIKSLWMFCPNFRRLAGAFFRDGNQNCETHVRTNTKTKTPNDKYQTTLQPHINIPPTAHKRQEEEQDADVHVCPSAINLRDEGGASMLLDNLYTPNDVPGGVPHCGSLSRFWRCDLRSYGNYPHLYQQLPMAGSHIVI